MRPARTYRDRVIEQPGLPRMGDPEPTVNSVGCGRAVTDSERPPQAWRHRPSVMEKDGLAAELVVGVEEVVGRHERQGTARQGGAAVDAQVAVEGDRERGVQQERAGL